MPPRKPYGVELAELDRPFDEIAQWAGIDSLRNLLMEIAGGPALFIGTGGTMAVARLAAILHEQVAGHLARAITPLELATLPPMTRSGAVLFSAGLSHPDALGALDRLASSQFRPAAAVTLRDFAEVAAIVPADVQAVVLPPLGFREGFLATSSVLAMAAALVRAYGGDEALPPSLPRPNVALPAPAENLLVLTTPGLAPVATDIETRCHELGLASVQIADYRNFAHGRHVGVLRRSKSTSILGLVDQPLERLATATLDALPRDEMEVTAWQAKHDGPAAVIELLVGSMELADNLATRQGVNPARPGAAPFGRRLYHLRLGRLLPPRNDGPVVRKLQALVATLDATATRFRYQRAFDAWLQRLPDESFGGLVLDYDGTVCATNRRYDLPDQKIQASLIRLLDGGVTLGFASGRGPSLHRDLRRWVDPGHWPRVATGLYNGGICVTLDEDLPDLSAPSADMQAVIDRLEQLCVMDALEIEPRSTQVTVSLKSGAYGKVGRLAELVIDAMAQPPGLAVKVVQSGHSIDVVPTKSSKRLVLDRIGEQSSRPVLAIGDQGDVGGNDFELLSATPWTLSVDRCSADPTRCWYLDHKGRVGPELLAAYLEVMKVADGELRMRWAGQ